MRKNSFKITSYATEISLKHRSSCIYSYGPCARSVRISVHAPEIVLFAEAHITYYFHQIVEQIDAGTDSLLKLILVFNQYLSLPIDSRLECDNEDEFHLNLNVFEGLIHSRPLLLYHQGT